MCSSNWIYDGIFPTPNSTKKEFEKIQPSGDETDESQLSHDSHDDVDAMLILPRNLLDVRAPKTTKNVSMKTNNNSQMCKRDTRSMLIGVRKWKILQKILYRRDYDQVLIHRFNVTTHKRAFFNDKFTCNYSQEITNNFSLARIASLRYKLSPIKVLMTLHLSLISRFLLVLLLSRYCGFILEAEKGARVD